MITVEKLNYIADQWTELYLYADDRVLDMSVGDKDEGPYWKLFHAFAAFKLALND